MVRMIKQECLGFLSHGFLPFVLALLPFSIMNHVAKFFARIPFLYKDVSAVALVKAKAANLVHEPDVNWLIRHRYHHLLDAADVYLAVLGRRKQLVKRLVLHEDVAGALSDADMLFFSHHGAGLGLHCLLTVQNRDVICLMNPYEKPWWSTDFFYGLLCRLRLQYLKKHTNTKVVYPSDLLTIRKAIKASTLIMLTPDVPRPASQTSAVVTELGTFCLANRFFNLAVSQQQKIATVLIENDYDTGLRLLNIKGLGLVKQAHDAMFIFATQLTQKLAEKSDGWMMLNVSDQLLHTQNEDKELAE